MNMMSKKTYRCSKEESDKAYRCKLKGLLFLCVLIPLLLVMFFLSLYIEDEYPVTFVKYFSILGVMMCAIGGIVEMFDYNGRMKKLASTYLIVTEEGIEGVTFLQNITKPFSLRYKEIVSAKIPAYYSTFIGNNIVIETLKEKYELYAIENNTEAVSLINYMMSSSIKENEEMNKKIKFCTFCGEVISDGVKFCGNCGQKVESE